MGRPRLADARKAERGTLRPNRAAIDAPEVDATDIPPPPSDLAPAVAATWARLAAEIQPLGVVGPGDMAAFRQLVRAVSRAEVLADNPDASTAEQCRAEGNALAHLQAFGLTPAARERASKAKRPVVEHDPIAEFMGPPLA